MAFVVEDGTGLANANAYIDPDYLDSYFEDRGQTVAGTEDEKKGWIVQATDYIETVFGWRLVGTKAVEGQALHFPASSAVTREGVLLDDDIVPEQLKKAAAEYAKRAKTGPLMPDPTVDATGFSVVTTRKKVGPIEKEFRVMGSNGPILVRSYPAADSLLINLLSYATGGTRVTR